LEDLTRSGRSGESLEATFGVGQPRRPVAHVSHDAQALGHALGVKSEASPSRLVLESAGIGYAVEIKAATIGNHRCAAQHLRRLGELRVERRLHPLQESSAGARVAREGRRIFDAGTVDLPAEN